MRDEGRVTVSMGRGRTLVAAFLFAASIPAGARTVASARDEVVGTTMEFLNVPYLWGGMHPQTGLDCSGFVQLVFRGSGLNLPRVARDQFLATVLVKQGDEVLPGDLVFFSMKRPGTAKVDHVGVYVGKGYFVHASFTNGIHIEPITKPYYQQRLVAIRRYRGF